MTEAIWGAALLALIPVTLLLGTWLSQSVGRRSLWPFATQLGLVPASAESLAGTYRGRAVTVRCHGRQVQVEARLANQAGLLDEWCPGTPLDGVPWLPPLTAVQLDALSLAPRVWDGWRLRFQGQSLEFTCPASPLCRPGRLQFLLDLLCDLAESVDHFGRTVGARRPARG